MAPVLERKERECQDRLRTSAVARSTSRDSNCKTAPNCFSPSKNERRHFWFKLLKIEEAHSIQFAQSPQWAQLARPIQPLHLGPSFTSLNIATPATPGLCRVSVEARPAAVWARFGDAAEIDALVGGMGRDGAMGCWIFDGGVDGDV